MVAEPGSRRSPGETFWWRNPAPVGVREKPFVAEPGSRRSPGGAFLMSEVEPGSRRSPGGAFLMGISTAGILYPTEGNKLIRAHITRGRSADQQTPSWIEPCPTRFDSSFQTHHYVVVFQEESTERESHSSQDMSENHWKCIHLLDQIEEF